MEICLDLVLIMLFFWWLLLHQHISSLTQQVMMSIFFEKHMINGLGFLITYAFAVAASVRFYISAIDLYNSSISFKN
ncbi:hypothetical protein DRY71_01755 [Salmonella enterica subsp. enterica serovar Newport]|uniref:Uncharacterized protein n=1 Tax=Salmonella newport TaxID=108619 RepID=A0A5U9KLY3_SALNE|nr:hypothetical protein [Salmonella enterica subsp. enterica serovar Newport]